MPRVIKKAEPTATLPEGVNVTSILISSPRNEAVQPNWQAVVNCDNNGYFSRASDSLDGLLKDLRDEFVR